MKSASVNSSFTSYFSILCLSILLFYALFLVYGSLNDASRLGLEATKKVRVLSGLKETFKNIETPKDYISARKQLKKKKFNGFIKKELKEIESWSNKAALSNKTLMKNKRLVFSEIFSLHKKNIVPRKMRPIISRSIQNVNKLFISNSRPEFILLFTDTEKEKFLKMKKSLSNLPRRSISSIDYVINALNKLSKSAKKSVSLGKNKKSAVRNINIALSKEISGIESNLLKNINQLQRNFYLFLVVVMFVIFMSIFGVKMSGKSISAAFKKKKKTLGLYLSLYGYDKPEEVLKEVDKVMDEDKDWNDFIREVAYHEKKFIEKNSAELSLSRSTHFPFVVFSSEGKAIYWNSHLVRTLGVGSYDEVGSLSLKEFFNQSSFFDKDRNFLESFPLPYNEFSSIKEMECLDLFLRTTKQEMLPIRAYIYPIDTGKLSGGILVGFEDRSDAEEEISRKITETIMILDDVITVISEDSTQPLPYLDLESVSPQVLPLLEKFKRLQIHLNEKADIFRSELAAVLSYVQKEQEILHHIHRESEDLSSKQDILHSALEQLNRTDGILSKNCSLAENRLENLIQRWKRLTVDIENKDKANTKAKSYENQVQKVVEQMQVWVKAFSEAVEVMRECRDWVKSEAINVNLNDKENKDVFRGRVRKFSISVSEFFHQLEAVEKDLKSFIDKHPGGMDFLGIDSGVDLNPVLEEMSKTYEDMAQYLAQWKDGNRNIKEASQKAEKFQEIIQKYDLELKVLNKNSLVLNENACQSLVRWSSPKA